MPANERPAVFLDRDGTLVVERHYLSDPDDVELVPGAAGAVRALQDAGFAVVVVTNQSGIARGLYTQADFRDVQRRIEAELARDGVKLDGVYHCPHHPDITGPCDCRKPGTALYRRAAAELGVDPTRSAFVGDRVKDVRPAEAFGAAGILVRTGYGAEHEDRAPTGVVIVDDLPAAVDYLLRNPADTGVGGA